MSEFLTMYFDISYKFTHTKYIAIQYNFSVRKNYAQMNDT